MSMDMHTQVLQFDFQREKAIAATVVVLPHGLGNFAICLTLNSKKKVIASRSVMILPGGSGNFDHS